MFGGSKRALHVIIMTIIMIHEMKRCSVAQALEMPNGINFIGIGYNILEGNPEGGDLSTGGVDPGLLVSRRIFRLTFEEKKISSDKKYEIPDEVIFVHRHSAYTTSTKTTFHGTASYASKLSAQVDVSGSYSGEFASVEFAASARYQKIAKRTDSKGSVFFATETIWNLGNARYLAERAKTDQYALDRGFVATACSLPSNYDKDTYMNFLNTWGTHVVIEVNLGIREGVNYEEDRSSFVDYASKNIGGSVNASGAYGGFSASVSVNMDSFNSGLKTGQSFGSKYSNYTVGSSTMKEPISIKVIGMHEVFGEKFWTRLQEYINGKRCTNAFERAKVGANVLKAMKGYAKSVAASKDPLVRIPVTWPEGTYGLPKPKSGCPNKEFKWNEGFRYHDTEDSNSNNQWSDPLHLAGYWGKNNIRHEFCMKTVSTVDEKSRWTWQPGSYCIYKYKDCPKGFDAGFIFWDDEDGDNENEFGGTVPSGVYTKNTKMEYCCRSDGVPSNAIFLPTGDNFYLFPRFEHCQEVKGMKVTKEYLTWDNANDSYWQGKNIDAQSEIRPYYGKLNMAGSYINLHYCYYQKA